MRIGSELGFGALIALLLLAAAADPARAAEGEPASGALQLLGAPEGRQVWVEGRYAGVLPLRVDSLPPGPVRLEIGGVPGSPLWQPALRVRARVRPGEVDTVRVGAAPRAESVDPGSAASQRTGAVDSRRGTLASSRLAAALPAAAIALGAAGVWSRHAADQAYEDYRRTLDRSAMARSLNRARRLDRTAVGCWIGAESCLVAAAWVLLRAGPEPPVTLSARAGEVRLGLDLRSTLAPGTRNGDASRPDGAP
jgi:hypothetical protein